MAPKRFLVSVSTLAAPVVLQLETDSLLRSDRTSTIITVGTAVQQAINTDIGAVLDLQMLDPNTNQYVSYVNGEQLVKYTRWKLVMFDPNAPPPPVPPAPAAPAAPEPAPPAPPVVKQDPIGTGRPARNPDEERNPSKLTRTENGSRVTPSGSNITSAPAPAPPKPEVEAPKDEASDDDNDDDIVLVMCVKHKKMRILQLTKRQKDGTHVCRPGHTCKLYPWQFPTWHIKNREVGKLQEFTALLRDKLDVANAVASCQSELHIDMTREEDQPISLEEVLAAGRRRSEGIGIAEQSASNALLQQQYSEAQDLMRKLQLRNDKSELKKILAETKKFETKAKVNMIKGGEGGGGTGGSERAPRDESFRRGPALIEDTRGSRPPPATSSRIERDPARGALPERFESGSGGARRGANRDTTSADNGVARWQPPSERQDEVEEPAPSDVPKAADVEVERVAPAAEAVVSQPPVASPIKIEDAVVAADVDEEGDVAAVVVKDESEVKNESNVKAEPVIKEESGSDGDEPVVVVKAEVHEDDFDDDGFIVLGDDAQPVHTIEPGSKVGVIVRLARSYAQLVVLEGRMVRNLTIQKTKVDAAIWSELRPGVPVVLRQDENQLVTSTVSEIDVPRHPETGASVLVMPEWFESCTGAVLSADRAGGVVQGPKGQALSFKREDVEASSFRSVKEGVMVAFNVVGEENDTAFNVRLLEADDE